VSNDPFAFDAPAEPGPVAEQPIVRTLTASSDDHKVRVTLKGGKGYDAPWITVDGTSIPDVLGQLVDHGDALKDLLDRASKVGAYFARLGNGAQTAPAGPEPTARSNQSSDAKPERQQAPGGQSKYCSHGEMVFKSGVAKSSGKPYKGFFCPSDDRDEQCKPEFIR
jgi:hypothetical protein